MDSIVRALFIYIFLLVVMRVSGKRTLAQLSAFDFILLLVIGEATQQALLGDDFSMMNAAIVILALVTFDVIFSFIKKKSRGVEVWADGVPILVMENGKLIKETMKKERIDKDDILEAARKSQGLENIAQIKHAILEKGGGITIIPKG